jgi:hypothetical protein
VALVDLRDRLDDPDVRRLLADAPAPAGEVRLVGWEIERALLGCAALARTEAGDVEIRALSVVPGPRGTEAGRGLVEALAETVNAPRLVARTDGDDVELYRASGFAAERRADGDGFTCVRVLDAAADESLPRAVGLHELEDAIRASWDADTAEDPASWSPANPARDQCSATALVVRELLGGDILIANVVRDGQRIERHAWNRLASGLEIDLTRSQFRDGQALSTPRVAEPLMTEARSTASRLLSARVRSALGL